MPTASPPRPRPRPRPRPAAPPPAGVLAGFLSRHPRLRQRGAIGAIAAGVILFVLAALGGSLAGADATHHPARHSTPAPVVLAAPSPTPTPSSVAVPAVSKILTSKPTHAAKPAPVTHGVISGLAANGIPKVALNAYRVAAARMANVQPGCGIDWALLAGIGREESDHGQFAGAVLHADGVSTPAIIGPALDGVHWDYIPAPANGLALDGDARYAHALGPMQFIPSTWAIYGTDANGDGKADVFNINDAALGAARYLCAAGGNLRTHAGQVAGVLAYNHSDQYLAQVLALADAYRRGIPVTGIPVGITSGPLPKVTDTGYVPPANPGPPTAVDRTTGTSHKSTKKAAPKAGSVSSSGSHPGSSTGHASTPAHASPSPSPKPGGGSSTTAAGKPSGTTSSPSPSPTPTPTCNQLQIWLGLCK